MTAKRFTQISSIAFGIFALYSAMWAVWDPRIHVNDLLRFGFILVAIIFGLALLFPHSFIPALRRRAEQMAPAPLKFLCGVLMCICLIVAMISGAANIWIVYPVATAFLVAFVFPGIAFRNLTFTPIETISLGELGQLAHEKLHKESKLKSGLLFVMYILMSVGLAWAVLGKQTLPSPWLGAVAGWASVLGGSVITIVIARPYLQALPGSARRGSLPGLAFWGFVILAISIVGCRALLLMAVPTSAAFFWGESATQNAIVIKSNPDKSRKGCYGSVDLQTAGGDIELCNLSRGFLEALTRGDTVVITGRATLFGQTIETLRLLKD